MITLHVILVLLALVCLAVLAFGLKPNSWPRLDLWALAAFFLVLAFTLSGCDKDDEPTANDDDGIVVNETPRDLKACPNGSLIRKDEICPVKGQQTP